jgi:hypothetical protein
MEQMTVREARAIDANAADWLLSQTSDGWIVQCNGATLVTVHGKRPRTFIDLNLAISRLKEDIGVRRFRLEAMK